MVGDGHRTTERDARRERLMARMGHDLRTPLTAIIGFSDIMEREMHGPLGSVRYQSYAGHIKDSGETLLQAIEQALVMAEHLADDGATAPQSDNQTAMTPISAASDQRPG